MYVIDVGESIKIPDKAPFSHFSHVKLKLTLLVNSKTLWMATLHPTVEGQRDRGCYVKQCSPMLLEIQWFRLNQQSLSSRYTTSVLT